MKIMSVLVKNDINPSINLVLPIYKGNNYGMAMMMTDRFLHIHYNNDAEERFELSFLCRQHKFHQDANRH